LKKADFVGAMKGYKAGTYGGAMKGVMAGQVKGLTDAQMEAIAGVIAK
jgi:cytochrome c553